MAIDYIIDQPCKVKEALPVDVLIPMIKKRNRAVTAFEMMKKKGKNEEKALDSTFKIQFFTPDGKKETKEFRISDLFYETKRLDDLQEFCKICPANCGKVFGCFNTIPYPISKIAEKWLIYLAKNALDSGPPNSMPITRILEQKMTGDRFNQLRKDPRGAFFELRKPLEIVVGDGFFRKTVNTNQILDMVLGTGRMKNPHMRMLLFFSGGFFIQDSEPEKGTYQQAYLMTSKEGETSWWVFHLRKNDTDDASIASLKEYFLALAVASGIQQEMTLTI